MANDILARLSVRIDAQTKEFGVALNALNQQLNKFGATVNAQTASISNFEKRIATIQRSLGSLGVAFGAFQIGTVIVDSVRRIADFEKQMDTVAAIAGATGEEFERLREDALRLGAASQFTATQVAELQTEFGRLGFTTEEILAATEATIDLATATGEDLAKSADVAGSTVRGFGLSAQETQRVVDVMAESFNRTALGLDNFTESMKFVAPVAKAANISVEETTALLGVLADAGIRGSNAGTALRRIITDLAKDGRPLQERLKELASQGLNLSGAMDEVGRFAQTALLVLTDNVNRIDQLTEGLNNAAGAAKETAAIMRDNLKGDIEKLTSAWDGFILSLDKSDGSVREVVQAITQLVEAITRLSNSGFGEFVADWFRFSQFIPRFLIDVTDKVSRWATATEITRAESEKLLRELNKLKETAELEGKTREAETYKKAIEELTREFSDLSKEAARVSPAVAEAIRKVQSEEKKRAIESTVNAALASENVEAYIRALDRNIYKEEIIAEIRRRQAEALKGQSGAISEQIGIIEALEARAKDLGDAIKKATSISEIRRLQHELEETKLRIDAILNPSTPPEPIKIPIEFEVPDLSIDGDEGRKLLDAVQNIIPKDGLVIPVQVEFLEETSEEFEERMKELKAKVEGTAVDISTLLANAVSGFAEAIGRATATGFENFGQDILRVVAGFAKQFGELLVASGFAALAAKVLIKNPLTAIAAGSALIAIASSLNESIGRAHQSAFGGGGSVNNATQARLSESSRQSIRVDFGTTEFKFNGKELVAAIKQEEFERGLRG